MDPVAFASILVSMVTAAAAYATSRASSKASKTNIETTSRVDMEKDAYNRARAFDMETIERQDEELKELREVVKRQNEEIRLLTERIARCEKDLPHNVKENDND